MHVCVLFFVVIVSCHECLIAFKIRILIFDESVKIVHLENYFFVVFIHFEQKKKNLGLVWLWFVIIMLQLC